MNPTMYIINPGQGGEVVGFPPHFSLAAPPPAGPLPSPSAMTTPALLRRPQSPWSLVVPLASLLDSQPPWTQDSFYASEGALEPLRGSQTPQGGLYPF